jgi:hypothetical protein
MSAQPLPNHVLMREVAKVVINEEMARVAADRELAAEVARLRERIDEFNSIVPPSLAVQVKTAIHLLHESPPVKEKTSNV